MPVILAGLDYDTPWTRDAAINAWNGASLMMPEVSRNTLLSVLVRSEGKVRIGGQYWDAIVWTTGAWNHYLYTGDKQFLALALEATRNSLAYFEKTEFDAQDGLFRGPGWSDGVAAYPDAYADAGGSSGILDWPKHNPDKVSKPGYGIPMKALSTNCLYYNAYVTAEKMAAELKAPVDPQWRAKAERLKKAINTQLWNDPRAATASWSARWATAITRRDWDRPTPCFSASPTPSRPRRCSPISTSRRRASPAAGRTSPLRKQGWDVVWPAHRDGLAADSGLLGRGRCAGRQAGDLRPRIVQSGGPCRAGQAVCRDLSPDHGNAYGGLQESQGRGIILWQADLAADLGGHRLSPHGAPGAGRNAIRYGWRPLPALRAQGRFFG